MNARNTEPETAPTYDSAETMRAGEYSGTINLGGESIAVRLVEQLPCKAVEGIEGAEDHLSLYADRAENYYSVQWLIPPMTDDPKGCVVKRHDGKQAMLFYLLSELSDPHFYGEFKRAIENPSFAFMPLVAANAKQPRKRAAKKTVPVFAVQLELATALVEVVGKFSAAPTTENLCEAYRSVSALHQAIHAPENFKLTANS